MLTTAKIPRSHRATLFRPFSSSGWDRDTCRRGRQSPVLEGPASRLTSTTKLFPGELLSKQENSQVREKELWQRPQTDVPTALKRISMGKRQPFAPLAFCVLEHKTDHTGSRSLLKLSGEGRVWNFTSTTQLLR